MTEIRLEKILIANRGEIAVRIIDACRKDGLRSVAVFSDADRRARHVRLADAAVHIGAAPPRESYLCIDAIIRAAQTSDADAIHPGYGFLSENAAFAEAVAAAGLTFIGPSPDAIRSMGDKALAKQLMREAGVPCIPGYDGADQDMATLVREAERVGYPIMIKAKAGGGGRGMRRVDAPDGLQTALISARSEAQNAFGNGDLLLERVITDARHVEVQIVGDKLGAVIHLGERDCSLQRRHQKLVEEAPAPAIDQHLREAMGNAACSAALAIGYFGVGTVEFLLDRDRNYYFLEMNTRLQVEHPVTELVTGLDLVGLQFDIARGRPLPLSQSGLCVSGHAIEARLCAEDPGQDFLPQSGVVTHWQPPTYPWLRIDHAVESGDNISEYYDPMIAKIIVHGNSRDQARRRLIKALDELLVVGVKTNRLFLKQLLEDETFASGGATTDYLSARLVPVATDNVIDDEALAMVAAVLLMDRETRRMSERPSFAYAPPRSTPFLIGIGSTTFEISVARSETTWVATCNDRIRSIAIAFTAPNSLALTIDGADFRARYHLDDAALHLALRDREVVAIDATYALKSDEASVGEGVLQAPMTGRIIHLAAAQGDIVEAGQLILVVEAMKMEHRITAPFAGTVKELFFKENDAVAARTPIAEIVTSEVGG